MQGVGYTDRAPEVPKHLLADYKTNYESRIRNPLQSIKVIGLDGAHAGSGLQVHDAAGEPMLHKFVAPQFSTPGLTWISKNFKLPLVPDKFHYGVEINEYDLHFPDEAFESESARPHLVERPAKFSLTIDVDNGLFVPRRSPLSSSG